MPTPFKNDGFCVCCDSQVTFQSAYSWFRDHYVCPQCRSVPRERALIYCLEMFCPAWRHSIIHESSPVLRGASRKVQQFCKEYIATQYYPDIPLGSDRMGVRCENLENLTFDDQSIDIHLTQDVMEHVQSPHLAFKELARTLKPGGVHIFTTPLVNKENPSEACIEHALDGTVKHLREPEYHGNPISGEGSLVTMRWGFDITDHIYKSCGLFTQILYIDSLSLGIRAEFIEVMITRKLPHSTWTGELPTPWMTGRLFENCGGDVPPPAISGGGAHSALPLTLPEGNSILQIRGYARGADSISRME